MTGERPRVQLVLPGLELSSEPVEAPRPRRARTPARPREVATDATVIHMSRGLDLTLCGRRVTSSTSLALSRDGVSCNDCKRRMAPKPRRVKGSRV